MGIIFRVVSRLTPASLIPWKGNILDKPKQMQEPTTGMERLQKMYSMRNHDAVSLELNVVAQSTFSGAFIGGCIGGWVRSRNAYLYFMETNHATIFKSTADAKKKLQDAVTLAFARGAYQWGWRMGAFMGIFTLISMSIHVYRNETSLLEYVVAGAVTGGLYKLNMGLVAMLVGAALGGFLSAVFGGIMILCLKVTGLDMEDIHHALFRFREFRERHYNEAQEKASDNKHDDVTKHHDKMVEVRGEEKLQDIK